MKKFIFFVLSAAFLFTCSVPVFAGDLPETLISDDNAQIYFGELIEVNVFSNDFKTVVKPVKKLKGDVNTGAQLEYVNPEFVGEFSAKKGSVYLFAYLNEANPLYVFEIDSYDTKALKISGIKGNDMWQRFLGYLHDGSVEKAEAERLDALGITQTPSPDPLPPIKNYNMEIYGLISILVAAVAFFIYTKVSKKRL